MTRLQRRFIFYGLSAVFLLATPPIILYSAGYSFDWQNHELVPTGALYLKSTPAGAQIYLNGKIKNTTPRLLSRLKPQKYKVIIVKKNFRPWRKNLSVSPGLVTEARNIFLIPENTIPRLLTTNATSSAYFENLKTPSQQELWQQAQQIASGTAGWTLKDRGVFYISPKNYILYHQSLASSAEEQISKEHLPSDNLYQIITNDKKHFVILSNRGELFLLKKNEGTFQKLDKGVKGAVLAADNKKIAHFNDHEIYVYFLQDILIQPYQKTGEKKLVTRESQRITQVLFYPNNEYLTYAVGDQIKIIELDGRDQRNAYEIFSVKNPEIYYHAQERQLYILGEGRLYSLNLEVE